MYSRKWSVEPLVHPESYAQKKSYNNQSKTQTGQKQNKVNKVLSGQ